MDAHLGCREQVRQLPISVRTEQTLPSVTGAVPVSVLSSADEDDVA